MVDSSGSLKKMRQVGSAIVAKGCLSFGRPGF